MTPTGIVAITGVAIVTAAIAAACMRPFLTALLVAVVLLIGGSIWAGALEDFDAFMLYVFGWYVIALLVYGPLLLFAAYVGYAIRGYHRNQPKE